MDFLALVEIHGWDTQDLLLQRYHASVYLEFDVGFVMLVPHDDLGIDVLVATSTNDNHSMEMWRVIRTLLMSRPRPILTQYERNYDKLFKASKRYGAKALEDNIVIFP